MNQSRRCVCVFCGSSQAVSERYLEAAAATGRRLAAGGLGVVYGGGRVGLMGALADAALAAGGEVVGVIPNALVAREVAHGRLSELIVVETMHERKALMAARAGAFLALPGGFGTLEEILEAITWNQLGIHAKPCFFFNIDGFYDALRAQFERAQRDRFVPSGRELTAFESDLDAVIDRILEAVS
jgi:hypothetical protein